MSQTCKPDHHDVDDVLGDDDDEVDEDVDDEEAHQVTAEVWPHSLQSVLVIS